MSSACRADGYTLLEVLVAMVVSGFVVSAGVTLALTVVERNRSLNTVILDHEHAANGADILQRLGASADLTSFVKPVVGDSAMVRFSSHCALMSPATHPCIVELRARPAVPALHGHMVADGYAANFLVRTSSAPVFLFLRSSVAGGVWVARWNDESPPMALGIATRIDTVVIPFGVHP